MFLRTFFICLLGSLYLVANAQSQQAPIGGWTDHIPYTKGNSVAAGKNGDIFCGSEAAFIGYNSVNREVTRYNTITGMSDVGVTILDYNKFTGSLLVAYKNGNLDILEGNRIINISSIQDNQIIRNKIINNIRFVDGLAYLSTGFGIVVLDMQRYEIKDTYFIGENSAEVSVNDVYLNDDDNTIYAATDVGVYLADLDENLSDFNNWSISDVLPLPGSEESYTLVEYFANRMLFNFRTAEFDSDIVYTVSNAVLDSIDDLSNVGNESMNVINNELIVSHNFSVEVFTDQLELSFGVYDYGPDRIDILPKEAIIENGRMWVADGLYGLTEVNAGSFNFPSPNGPNTISVNDIDILGELLWSASGLLDPDYREARNAPEVNRFSNLTWTGWNRNNTSEFDSLYGLVKVQINPADPEQVFMGSWDKGLLEMREGEVFEIYDGTNFSEYGHTLADSEDDIIRIGGLEFDNENNLWMTMSSNPLGLHVKQADGIWHDFNLSPYVDNNTIVGEMLITPEGHKWILLNRAPTANRIVVYDDAGTPSFRGDDRITALSTEESLGSIPGSIINCFAQDESGAIWIGTNEGPAVFYNPSDVFSTSGTINAQRIFVEQDGQTQILLETENILSIKIDGANRKWIGTANSGAFLMSEDGTLEVNHFTRDDSPLFSDIINDIDINDVTGDVFFCTSEGLISFRGTATKGSGGFSDVQVFPNPVQKGFDGPIAIRGLAQNANVKITDVNGVLIYETTASGGQAIWNGYSLTGRKASNGVYLVFSTDPGGGSSAVTKFLFLNN